MLETDRFSYVHYCAKAGPAATEVKKFSKSMCKLIPAEAVEPNSSKRPADVAEDEKEAKRKRALELLGDDL